MRTKKNERGFAAATTLVSSLAVAAMFCFAGCFNSVGTGEAGMKVAFGEITSREPLAEGLYFYPPWTSLVVYDCRNKTLKLATETFTKDVQYSKIVLAVTYAVDRSAVLRIHRDTGKSYEEVILNPNVAGALKDVIGNWEADAIMASRSEIVASISKLLSEKVAQYGLLVKNVELVNIDFSDEFEKAVENKQIAMQRAIQAKNKTREIEEESRQKLIAAEAEAKAMAIRAEALKSNRDVLLADAINRWDGKLPNLLSIGNGTGVVPVADALNLVK